MVINDLKQSDQKTSSLNNSINQCQSLPELMELMKSVKTQPAEEEKNEASFVDTMGNEVQYRTLPPTDSGSKSTSWSQRLSRWVSLNFNNLFKRKD